MKVRLKFVPLAIISWSKLVEARISPERTAEYRINTAQ